MKALIMYTILFAACMHKVSAANTLNKTDNSHNEQAISDPLPKMKSHPPCFVNVTVPRTGASMDNCGNYHFINATGSCTAYAENCDLAFFEAKQCASNKANEDYNIQLYKIRQIQCRVSSISVE